MSKKELRKSLKHWKKELSAIELTLKAGGKSLILLELLFNKRDEYRGIVETIQKQMGGSLEKNTKSD